MGLVTVITSGKGGAGKSTVSVGLGCTLAKNGKRGRHQWLIEWEKTPVDLEMFAMKLDEELRKLNSDYDAKRNHTIFLDPPEVISAPSGLFDRWLKSAGTHKLGGQRKVPRLSNKRDMMEQLLAMI